MDVTVFTNVVAASSILIFSLADVSNQAANPFSLTNSSSFEGELARPSLGLSHYIKKIYISNLITYHH